MNVQSLSYFLFLLLVWTLALFARGRRPRQILLLAASCLFYATWSPAFLALLLIASVVNYGLVAFIRRRPSLLRLWLGVGANLLLLAAFKYLPALAGTGIVLSGAAETIRRIGIPVGISFWTFQALSSLFDTYRDEEETRSSLVEYCLYLAFWPTVLSGPVCRLPELLPQFRDPARLNYGDAAEGVRRIVLGLFMKLCLSRTLASGLLPGQGIDPGFDHLTKGWGGLDVWVLAVGFGFQLFFDFAGYSHIVIGTARLFGVRLPENFQGPYLSTSPSIFWTRWHMSLSFWIRDYLFLPLATLRRGAQWRHVALLVSMVVFGIWHGASLAFLCWGAYHGLLLVFHRWFLQLQRRFDLRLPAYLGVAAGWALTFGAVSLGWIMFRAHSLGQALGMYRAAFSPARFLKPALDPMVYLIVFAVVCGYFLFCGLEALHRKWRSRPIVGRLTWFLSPAYYHVLLVAILIWSIDKTVFVYFQF